MQDASSADDNSMSLILKYLEKLDDRLDYIENCLNTMSNSQQSDCARCAVSNNKLGKYLSSFCFYEQLISVCFIDLETMRLLGELGNRLQDMDNNRAAYLYDHPNEHGERDINKIKDNSLSNKVQLFFMINKQLREEHYLDQGNIAKGTEYARNESKIMNMYKQLHTAAKFYLSVRLPYSPGFRFDDLSKKDKLYLTLVFEDLMYNLDNTAELYRCADQWGARAVLSDVIRNGDRENGVSNRSEKK